VGFGPPMVEVSPLADAINAMPPGGESALPSGAWAALIRAHGGERVGYGRHPRPSAWRGDPWGRLCLPCGIRTCGGAVKGDRQGAPAVLRTALGDVEGAVAARVGLALLLGRLRAGRVREAAEARPRPAARPGRSRHVRPRGLPGLQAVIPRPPCLRAPRDHQRCCRPRQDWGAWRLRTPGGLVHRRPRLPLPHALGGQVIALGQRGEALSPLLAGAAVAYRSHQASREGQC
jgi:hypothetical protein